MASNIGESFEYLGNRDYREGDNPRDMDWRATARAQAPIVREWVEEYMLRVHGPDVYDDWTSHRIPFASHRATSRHRPLS